MEPWLHLQARRQQGLWGHPFLSKVDHYNNIDAWKGGMALCVLYIRASVTAPWQWLLVITSWNRTTKSIRDQYDLSPQDWWTATLISQVFHACLSGTERVRTHPSHSPWLRFRGRQRGPFASHPLSRTLSVMLSSLCYTSCTLLCSLCSIHWQWIEWQMKWKNVVQSHCLHNGENMVFVVYHTFTYQ